jgi:methionine-rich copper-binding protein CopC
MFKTSKSFGRLVVPAIAFAFAMLLPVSVVAHAELETSSPTDGSTVPGPFEGPIVLTFSADLVEGSKADLVDAGGGKIASAVVDGPGANMTITVEVPLGPDDYDVKWVSVAENGDLERGTVSFTVAPPPPTPQPTPEATPTPVVSASAAPATPSPAPTLSASSEPSVTPVDAEGSASTGDEVIPIVVAL